MSLRCLASGLFLVVFLGGCKWMQRSSITKGLPDATEADAVIVSENPAPLPVETPTQETNEAPLPPAPPVLPEVPVPPPAPVELPCDGVNLVVDTQQLGSATFQARIEFKSSLVDMELITTAKPSSLCLKGLTATDEPVASMLSLYLWQNGQLRYVARRANTIVIPKETKRIVIDSCLIQAIPWDGRTNDGSCEWTIQDLDF